MKHLPLLILFILLSNCVIAQSEKGGGKQALSIELGKPGLIYNLTFDNQFPNKMYGYRVFAGSNFEKFVKVSTAGLGGYSLFGRAKNLFELGMDLSYLSIEKNSDDQRRMVLIYTEKPIQSFYVSANFGYRRSGTNSLFRIGFSPGFTKKDFVPGGYISFGIVF